ncbi:MAG: ethanolamine ammonia-lyase reactivating factor EutA, partial [Blautia sp.]
MQETILSVGIDIGTSTTQLIFSKLTIENLASNYTVPRISIVDKKVIYRSGIYFTPLKSQTEIDAVKVKDIIRGEYEKAGIQPADLQTGAVIITGETARKPNANSVLEALSDMAGEFVVATAGPDLESVLSAKGVG